VQTLRYQTLLSRSSPALSGLFKLGAQIEVNEGNLAVIDGIKTLRLTTTNIFKQIE
jgi:hypothetical protein